MKTWDLEKKRGFSVSLKLSNHQQTPIASNNGYNNLITNSFEKKIREVMNDLDSGREFLRKVLSISKKYPIDKHNL